jgi:hypothetical protein
MRVKVNNSSIVSVAYLGTSIAYYGMVTITTLKCLSYRPKETAV